MSVKETQVLLSKKWLKVWFFFHSTASFSESQRNN